MKEPVGSEENTDILRFRPFNWYVAKRDPLPPRKGTILGSSRVFDVYISTFVAVVPFVWYGEVVTFPKFAPRIGSICLAESEGWEDLSLARFKEVRSSQLILRVIRLPEPNCVGQNKINFVMQEGYGVGGQLRDCIRDPALDCREEVTAISRLDQAETFFAKWLQGECSPYTEVDEAKWNAQRDIFPRTISAVSTGADNIQLERVFAEEVYRQSRVMLEPVTGYDIEKRKRIRRHKVKRDRINRAIAQGYNKANFSYLTSAQKSKALTHAGFPIAPEAEKKRSQRLTGRKRKPGPVRDDS